MADRMIVVAENGDYVRVHFKSEDSAAGIAEAGVAKGFVDINGGYTIEAKGGKRTVQGAIIYNWRYVVLVA